ncbi:MAG: hypothetical protein ISS23_03455 [Nanoarchaeota archaeon]|nr:hypothetical protein [Nanoarchaeota archaeon]
MALLKLLGLMDITAIAIFLLFKFELVPQIFLIIALIYLTIKAMIFFKDFASLIDFGVIVIFTLTLFGIYNILTWIAVFWILQKAVLSLFT